jgi:hypothetical protein
MVLMRVVQMDKKQAEGWDKEMVVAKGMQRENETVERMDVLMASSKVDDSEMSKDEIQVGMLGD